MSTDSDAPRTSADLRDAQDFLRQDELRKHVTDAAIAQQLVPPTDAQWLAKCARVSAAQAGR